MQSLVAFHAWRLASYTPEHLRTTAQCVPQRNLNQPTFHNMRTSIRCHKRDCSNSDCIKKLPNSTWTYSFQQFRDATNSCLGWNKLPFINQVRKHTNPENMRRQDFEMRLWDTKEVMADFSKKAVHMKSPWCWKF